MLGLARRRDGIQLVGSALTKLKPTLERMRDGRELVV